MSDSLMPRRRERKMWLSADEANFPGMKVEGDAGVSDADRLEARCVAIVRRVAMLVAIEEAAGDRPTPTPPKGVSRSIRFLRLLMCTCCIMFEVLVIWGLYIRIFDGQDLLKILAIQFGLLIYYVEKFRF